MPAPWRRRRLRRGSARCRGPLASARPSLRARRSPRPCRGRAAMPAGRLVAAVQRALGAGRPPAIRERPASPPPAASTNRSTTQRSAAGSLTNRCSATRAEAPGCSAAVRGSGGSVRAPHWGAPVDPVADERVHERQRSAVLNDPRPPADRLHRLPRALRARQSRGVEQVALLENRERSCQLPGMPRRTIEPEEAERPPFDRAGDAFLAQRFHEFVHEERHSARYAQTGIDDGRIGRPPSFASTSWATAALVRGGRRITSRRDRSSGS